MLEERLGTTPKRDRTLEIDGEYFIVIVLLIEFLWYFSSVYNVV